jgi:hypothetical protein
VDQRRSESYWRHGTRGEFPFPVIQECRVQEIDDLPMMGQRFRPWDLNDSTTELIVVTQLSSHHTKCSAARARIARMAGGDHAAVGIRPRVTRRKESNVRSAICR